MIIYKITNKINQMVYIGLTIVPINKRWTQHKSAANRGLNTPLYNAMRKYGIDNFTIELLKKCNTEQELKQSEIDAIKEYSSYIRDGKGYNLTLGGDGLGKIDHNFGEGQYKALLTDKMVEFIRDPKHWNISHKDMVQMVNEKFGTEYNKDTLKDARNGKSWKHLNIQFPPLVVKKGSRRDKKLAIFIKDTTNG